MALLKSTSEDLNFAFDASVLAHANTLAEDVKGQSKYFFRRPASVLVIGLLCSHRRMVRVYPRENGVSRPGNTSRRGRCPNAPPSAGAAAVWLQGSAQAPGKGSHSIKQNSRETFAGASLLAIPACGCEHDASPDRTNRITGRHSERANRDRSSLSALCPGVVDEHVPAVIDKIAMPVTRVRAEDLDVVGGFNVEASPKHLFPRRAVNMNVLKLAARPHPPVHHGLVARDAATAAQHAGHGKNTGNGCKTSPG